jgi:hypothetical protein
MAKRQQVIYHDGINCPCRTKQGGRKCRKYRANHRANCENCPHFGDRKRQPATPQPLQSKARI